MINLERLGVWITKNPAVIIAAALLLTLVSVHYAQQIESTGLNTESFVSKDSTLYQVYNRLYLENFGIDANVILIEGDDVAKAEVLSASLRFSDHMKQVHNVVRTRSLADIVADAEYQKSGIRRIPSQERIEEILASADPSELASLMADRSHSRMIVGMPARLNEAQRKEVLQEIDKGANFADYPAGYGIIVTGDPAFQASVVEMMYDTNASILALAGLMMIAVLLLIFRHVRWPFLPLLIVFLGIIWTFGAMGFFRIPMSIVTFAAFPILIGIGIDYSIQFHNRIDEELVKGKPLPEAAISTVNHLAIPIIIALAITEAGLAALLNSTVPMINDFGKLCIIGLVMCYLSALFVNVTILYRLEGIFPRKRKVESQTAYISAIGFYIERTATLCIENWKAVLTLALVLALTGIYVDTLVPIETNVQNYIPQDLEPLIDLKHMKAIFGGTDSIKLLVQADDVTDPENLGWMDDFGDYLLTSREDQTVSVTSIATYIRAANGGEIPNDRTGARDVISSLPEEVQNAYISGHNLAVIDVNIGDFENNYGTRGMDRLIKAFESDAAWIAPPPGVLVKVTGDWVLITTLIEALTTGRLKMSLMGLVFIFVLLVVIYKDIIKALLPVLPMVIVIGWLGGVMYYGGLKYTPLTATLGALVIGVGSEYAILMMERFYEELEKTGDIYESLEITARQIGSALMASGMTTIFGFGALIASPFSIISNFGLVTVLSVVFALISTFTVFVVLMMRMEIRRQRWINLKETL